jgi:hypothetical protein
VQEITALNSSDIPVVRLFNDILSRIFITKGGPVSGINGLPIETHKISPVFISFNSSVEKHREQVFDLTIFPINFQYNIPSRQCGILGINVLKQFNILPRGKYGYLQKINK